MAPHPLSRAFPHLLLAASAALAGGCSGAAEPTEPPTTSPVPAALLVVSGDGQHGISGQTLPQPVIVQVLDSTHQPVLKQKLTFEVLSGGGSVSSDTTLTDGSGMATVSWTLGTTPHSTQALFVRVIDRNPGGHLLYATLTAVAETPPTNVTLDRVYAGVVQSCGLTAEGAAYCWGSDALGTGARSLANVPTAVSGGLRFTRLSLGLTTCGLTLAGTAYCWGGGAAAPLGSGTTADALVPVAVSGGLTFQDIESGYGQTCALTPAGDAYCWGVNTDGALGDGTTIDRLVPTAVAGGLTFGAIAPGFTWTCALTTSGSAYCWGTRPFTSSIHPALTPTRVADDVVFTSISAGFDHACGLTADGQAYCWGRNGVGQLGDSSVTSSEIPVLAAGGQTFTAVNAGAYHTCALRPDQQVVCWGWDDTWTDSKAFNRGASIHSLVPVPLPGGLKFASFDEGDDHGCGMTTDQVAYCWFNGIGGMLGDGTDTDGSYQPLKVR